MYDTVIAKQHVQEVYDIFLPVHPELAEPLQQCLEGYDIIAEIIKGFAQTAWGKEEINWEGWRGMGLAQYRLQEPIDDELAPMYNQTQSKEYKSDAKKD
jgi:hypothetical protein